MNEQTCCFTGNRKIKFSDYILLKIKLKRIIKTLLAKNVNCFMVGGALGFDTLAAEILLKLKKTNQKINIILAAPCPDQSKFWKDTQKHKYNYIKSKVDKVIILSQKYFNGCMQKRNRYLVDNSHFCITYNRKKTGGTLYTINYAKAKNLEIFYL